MFGEEDLSIAGLAVGGVSSIANFGLGLANYRYQKKLQKEIFRREDTSINRRVHDLKASGLSPVLAAGQGADTGGIVSTRQPEIDPTLATAIYTSLATMEKDFAVKDEQIQNLRAQRELTDMNTLIKAWDYEKYVQSGMASNASGLAKTLRDIYGLSKDSEASQGLRHNPVVKIITDKIKKDSNEYDIRQQKNIERYQRNKSKPFTQRLKESFNRQFLGIE